jgi:hypothetical protein
MTTAMTRCPREIATVAVPPAYRLSIRNGEKLTATYNLYRDNPIASMDDPSCHTVALTEHEIQKVT